MIEEKKCFGCRGFEYIAHHYRKGEEERSIQMFSNQFEVLKYREEKEVEEK